MKRVDQALVERGLSDSREKARRAVMAGHALVNRQPARKPSDAVADTDDLALAEGERFVSRGGHKLEHAFAHFGLDVVGATAVDLGASTGGFTDCLLQRGAARVFAVDVGHGQLAWKLRQDPRVVVMERTNARTLTPEAMQQEPANPRAVGRLAPRADVGRSATGATPHSAHRNGADRSTADRSTANRSTANRRFDGADIVVVDCSFISLRLILPAAVALLRPGGRIVALVKPQFEAGKAEADRGAGVIRDAAVHRRVMAELQAFVGAKTGLAWSGEVESPLLGPAGNKEFLVLLETTR